MKLIGRIAASALAALAPGGAGAGSIATGWLYWAGGAVTGWAGPPVADALPLDG